MSRDRDEIRVRPTCRMIPPRVVGTSRFFTDFTVERKDGRIVLVEHKTEKMASDPEEQHKKAVGELWASRSEGRYQFAWIVDKDWHKLNAELHG